MKVKITFELDLTDTNYDISKVRLIPVCLQNLGQWFYELHLHYLQKRLHTLGEKIHTLGEKNGSNPEVVKAIAEHQKQELKLSEQLFNNYKVEGITGDGHTFEFTHKDPGYYEVTLVDGKDTFIEPIDE